MKKTLFFLVIVVLSMTSMRVVTGGESCEPFPGYNKLDTQMRGTWQQTMAMGEMDVLIPCLIKVTAPITEEKKAALATAGVEVRTVLTTIITAKVLLAKLPELVALDFVLAIEGSKQVGFKRGVWK